MQVVFADAAQLGGHRRTVVAHQVLQVIKAVGMSVDEGAVDPAFLQHDVQNTVEQGHVGAGLYG